MSEVSDHWDIEELKKEGRKGWFVKAAADMPKYKTFRASCEKGGHGFLGPNFGAHHIIPLESIDKSTAKLDQQQVADIKYITPFILNHPDNMLGLPSFWSFDTYYKVKRQENGESQANSRSGYPGLSARWMNSYKKNIQEWMNSYKKSTQNSRSLEPENHPIHHPLSWGHTEYSNEVADRLTKQVWIVLKGEQSKHKIKKDSLRSIEDALKEIEGTFHAQLTERGATSLSLWERRKNPADNDWYAPYTMTDINKNPIWG
jgi:hypothetical protein